MRAFCSKSVICREAFEFQKLYKSSLGCMRFLTTQNYKLISTKLIPKFWWFSKNFNWSSREAEWVQSQAKFWHVIGILSLRSSCNKIGVSLSMQKRISQPPNPHQTSYNSRAMSKLIKNHLKSLCSQVLLNLFFKENYILISYYITIQSWHIEEWRRLVQEKEKL